MAALNEALREAIADVSPEHAQELRHVVAGVMAEIGDTLITPAVRAFPELDLDESTWIAVAKARAGVRFNAPVVGQDTDAVLREVGLTEAQIGALRQRGVVG